MIWKQVRKTPGFLNRQVFFRLFTQILKKTWSFIEKAYRFFLKYLPAIFPVQTVFENTFNSNLEYFLLIAFKLFESNLKLRNKWNSISNINLFANLKSIGAHWWRGNNSDLVMYNHLKPSRGWCAQPAPHICWARCITSTSLIAAPSWHPACIQRSAWCLWPLANSD